MTIPLDFTEQEPSVSLALDQSVIDHPTYKNGQVSRFAHTTSRGPLLPKHGTRERERALLAYYRHDYNTLFRGAISGLVKKVQSTPWEVKSDFEDGDKWQSLLMQADFGDWDRFLSKVVVGYSRHDMGIWIELIAPGDPLYAPVGAVVGLAVLDPLRCLPTGDPDYPLIYYDMNSQMHVMHRARVLQFIDSPDAEEQAAGYGDCALSRCIAPVARQILMGRYVEQYLDDKPPPGFMIMGNLGGEAALNAAIDRMRQRQNTDNGGEWGRTVNLFGLKSEDKPTVEFISYAKAPEGFDYEKYTALDVKQIALGIGLDIQDMWELSGAGIGTGQQSEVLAQKSRGKAFGRILKGLERVLNHALPEHVEFEWKYEDPQADMEQAQVAQAMASAIQTSASVLAPDEQRELLANTIPAYNEVLVKDDGTVRRLADADPKSPGQLAVPPQLVPAPENLIPPTPAVGDLAALFGFKSFGETATAFASEFARLTGLATQDEISRAAMRAVFRGRLLNGGEKAYDDGLKDGGADPRDLDAEGQGMRRLTIGGWYAAQTPYIDKLAIDASGAGWGAAEIARRAELWVSKSLRQIYYAGLAEADSQSNYEWALGNTEGHCPTCLSLNGQVHKLKDYVRSNLLPGSAALECKGFQCDCSIQRTSRRSGGSLPGQPATLGAKLAAWLRGLIGR